MKYLLDNRHREFYTEHGWIEFEELLPMAELAAVNAAIGDVIAKRLSLSSAFLERLSSHDLFMAGRDVWRDNETVKKLSCSHKLGEMAADLVEQRPVRLAFDQVYFSNQGAMVSAADIQPVSGSLSNVTSFQGLLCGLLLCLETTEETPAMFFPKQAGSGTFIAPHKVLNFDSLFNGARRRYLLIGYSKAVSLFVSQPDDPHGITLRKLGYNYGDRLRDQIHPIVCR